MSHPIRLSPVLVVALAVSCAHREGPAGTQATSTSASEYRPSDGYRCTQVMGVSVTGDWFNAGFERGIDGDRWQVLWRKKAFVHLWADPNDALWSVPVQSPCAEGAAAPDRVIFTPVNWEYTTEAEWKATLARAVATIKGKYPSVKRIELLTMLRAPGNVSCGNVMSVVQPFVDSAIAAVAAASDGSVVVGPKVEAPTCEIFTKGGPHFPDAAMPAVADLFRAALVGAPAPVASR